MGKEDLQLSIIIAVYERQDELTELLSSLVKQTDKLFEIIIVDDGSQNKLDTVCAKFETQLDLHYYYKTYFITIVIIIIKYILPTIIKENGIIRVLCAFSAIWRLR